MIAEVFGLDRPECPGADIEREPFKSDAFLAYLFDELVGEVETCRWCGDGASRARIDSLVLLGVFAFIFCFAQALALLDDIGRKRQLSDPVENLDDGLFTEESYAAKRVSVIPIAAQRDNSDGSPKANGTYYIFDMYSSTKADEACPILPNGKYSYDEKNSYTTLTFTEEGSWYAVMDAKGEYAKSGSFKDASVTVTDGKFEAIVELTSGEKHHIEC